MKKRKEEDFLQITYSLLKDKTLSTSQKILISYLKSFQRTKGEYCYDTQENIANDLGFALITIKKDIKELTEKNIIFLEKKRDLIGGKQYKNRKAIILVDDNNPLPTKDEAPQADSIKPEPDSIEDDADLMNEIRKSLTNRYNNGHGKSKTNRNLSPAEFHTITDNSFTDIPFIQFFDIYKKHDTKTLEGFLQLFDELFNHKYPKQVA